MYWHFGYGNMAFEWISGLRLNWCNVWYWTRGASLLDVIWF